MNRDLALLLLRISTGLMMALGHGLGKVRAVIAGDFSFPDPIGIGAAPSLILAALAEFFCALLVALGVKTRYCAIPLVITMLVAALLVHADDPWGKKEFALLYAIPFAALVLAGGGRYTLESLWARKR